MKKNSIIITLALGMAALPVFADTTPETIVVAVNTENMQATEAQIFTACSQTAIEVRDSAISSSRTAYNNGMAIALNVRKEAEKKAVAMTDADEKKDAIKAAVEEYKKAVTQAQDALTKARKEAWAQFETNTNNCRETSKESATTLPAGNEGSARTMHTATTKVETVKTEEGGFKESFIAKIESIKNFFKK